MTRRAGEQAMADVPAALPQQREEEENVTRRAGKELVEDDVPAANPLQLEDDEESKDTNKNKRIQVELRHKKVKIHFGSFDNKFKADFARDCSLYFKLCCQPPSQKDKYYYRWSPIIFEKFECLAEKLALVPIYKQLHLQPIRRKGESKDEMFVQFGKAARNRIKEMIPDLRDALLKDAATDEVSHMDKVCHAKVAVMEQLADKDWVLLGEFLKIFAKGRLMDIIWSTYLSGEYSFEHDYQGYGHHATSAPQEENISAAKTLVLEHIDDKDWLMLGEFVPIVGIRYIMFTLCNSLSDISPFEQDFLSDAHYEMPVHLQETNSGYASFDHAQNSTTCEALAAPSSNTDDQVLMNQSSENVDSDLQRSSLKIQPLVYPFISREDDLWWCKDLE